MQVLMAQLYKPPVQLGGQSIRVCLSLSSDMWKNNTMYLCEVETFQVAIIF